MPRHRTPATAALEVHLYGKLRRACGPPDPSQDCILQTPVFAGDTVADVIARFGFTPDDLGLVFINGRLAAVHTPVKTGSRLGLFPDDQSLLYKWYFPKTGG